MDVETGYLYYRRERWVKRRCGMESLLSCLRFVFHFKIMITLPVQRHQHAQHEAREVRKCM